MKKREIKQGEVYYCNSKEIFDLVDSEQEMDRWCLVLSVDSLNKNRNNVNVIPITKAVKKYMINHYHLYKKDYDGFTYEDNTVLLECIRDISKSRLERKLCSLSEYDLNCILDLIKYNFKEYDFTC